MTTATKIIKTKVGVLELAKQLGKVSRACKIMGYNRDTGSLRTGHIPEPAELDDTTRPLSLVVLFPVSATRQGTLP